MVKGVVVHLIMMQTMCQGFGKIHEDAKGLPHHVWGQVLQTLC
jgi:hypothetical protein